MATNLKEIQDFIKAVARFGIAEVKLETEELKLNVKFPLEESGEDKKSETTYIQQFPVPQGMQAFSQMQMGPPVQAATTTTTPVEYQKEEKEEDKKYLTIKSPMVGTFYKKPSPDKPDYVNVGDEITKGKVLCIIEAMKLFNEIEAEISGKIVKILVDDATPVEYDQPLFLVEP